MHDLILEAACNRKDWVGVLLRLKEIELSKEDLEPLYGSAEQTILHLLAANCQLEALNAIFSKITVDVNIRDKLGRSPLHLAVEYRHLTVIKILVERKADVNLVDKKGHAPIHALNADKNSRGIFIQAAANIVFGEDSPQDIIQFLFENGANLDIQNRNGETVLHHAAASGRAGLASLLLDGGADANAQDKKGGTALHNAIKYFQGQAAQVLLERSDSGRIADNKGVTPAQLLEGDARFAHGIALQSVTSRLNSGSKKGVRSASAATNSIINKVSSTTAMPASSKRVAVVIEEELDQNRGCCWTAFIQKVCKIAMSRYD
jgi:ankyrin repeat protein